MLREKEELVVVITTGDYAENLRMKEKMDQLGIRTDTIERLIFHDADIVGENRKYIADYHRNGMEDYFENAEQECSMDVFWDEYSIFYQKFKRLDMEKIVELACGRGRHVPRYIQKAGKVVLVDILEKNIAYCKERFKKEKKIEYYCNSGHDLKSIDSDSCTALFCYDAMVHFEMLDIFDYLKETGRILRCKGKALFHHSNNTENPQITFSTGTDGRNYMSKELFAYLAGRAGLRVVEQEIIPWNGTEGLDCLTLVEKI